MLASSSRLATSVSTAPLKLREASAQLLPPIPLYRRLLRSHRKLPEEMRFMGDSYVKAEFRRTRTTDNPIHIIGFLSQWKLYLDDIESTTSVAASPGSADDPAAAWRGRKLSEEVFEKLSNEQAGQLYEVMHATRDIWKTPTELEAQAIQAELEELNSLSEEPEKKKEST